MCPRLRWPRSAGIRAEPGKAARLGQSVLFGGPMGNYDTEQADNARSSNFGCVPVQ
jgi:hypothetical protein